MCFEIWCQRYVISCFVCAAAMIRGNRANCAQFAQSYRLDWLVNRLESQQSSKGMSVAGYDTNVA